jgi:hypothetical protein
VRIDDRKLPDNEDLKRELTDLGIEFVEREDGIIVYAVDADSLKEQLHRKRPNC